MTATINGEAWLDQAEFAAYIGRSRSTIPDAMRRYREKTGKEIEKMPNGRVVYVRQSDVDEMIRVLFPVLARKRGLD